MENKANSSSLVKKANLSREAIVKQMTDRLLRYALRTHVPSVPLPSDLLLISNRTGTKLILIVGHLRSGKSSLFESLTGETGHSKRGIDSGK